MARNQVYGKRSHLYSKANLFTSPAKSRADTEIFEIAEVAEELGRLSVYDQEKEQLLEGEPKKRKPLSSKDVNETSPAEVADLRHGTTSKDGRKARSRPAKKEKITPGKRVETAQEHVIAVTQNGIEDVLTPSVVTDVERGPQEDQENAPPTRPQALEEELCAKFAKTTIISKPQTPNVYETHTSDILKHSLRPLTCFSAWSEQLSSHFTINKIAEASFGEVYRLSLIHQYAGLSKSDESVLKIIALKPPQQILKRRRPTKAAKARMAMMSNPEDVAGEVRLLQRMSCIPGFTNFRDVSIVQGRPGASFVEAWKSWNEDRRANGKDTSEYPDPGKKASYTDDQLWAVIEMQDAGTDLENTSVGSIWMAWDVFWGVVLAMGKGEEGARFEHRDLHLGNICVSHPRGVLRDWKEEKVHVKKRFGFTGIETTIIDYTISRAEMSEISLNNSPNQESDVAFFDLEKDPAIFEGDPEKEYQYNIYRYMRSAMYLDEPMADIYERWDEATETGRTWEGYHPQTNLVWLHFVLHKLLGQLEWPSSNTTGTAVQGRAAEARWKRSCELEQALQRVQILLDPHELPQSGLRSAGDLVALALKEGWLDIEDVL